MPSESSESRSCYRQGDVLTICCVVVDILAALGETFVQNLEVNISILTNRAIDVSKTPDPCNLQVRLYSLVTESGSGNILGLTAAISESARSTSASSIRWLSHHVFVPCGISARETSLGYGDSYLQNTLSSHQR